MTIRDTWLFDLKTIVNSYTTAIWIDFDSEIGQFRSGGISGNLWDIKTEYNQDGVHLNLSGYAKMAEIINIKVKEQYFLM